MARGPRSGAWKVAYADFVTALMALFIVLWLLNSGKVVQNSVMNYFRDPRGHHKSTSRAAGGSGPGIPIHAQNVNQLKHNLEEALKELPEFQTIRNHVRILVTGEGLRIELLETEQGMFFDSGKITATPAGDHLLQLVAGELQRLPNPVIVEGHTDSRPFRKAKYTNWDLSLERANTARQVMEQYGVRPDQVVQIRGFADKKLLVPENPEDARNRRISVTVVYGPADGELKPAEDEPEGAPKPASTEPAGRQ